MSMCPHRQRGFTLGELMTTLAIAGITLAIAVPGFQSVTRNNRQATSVNQLVAAMHLARSEAVTRNIQVTICPSSDGTACGGAWQDGWILFPDRDQDRVRDDGEDRLSGGEFPDGLTIASEDFPDFITFRPNGRAMAADFDANTGLFTFCDDRGATFARAVRVEQSGQPLIPQDSGDLGLACPEGD